mmetsp:Transcript_1902/g.7269  ORF Transcript_1902/g.7269 Transcript_1902/m.7269 type:complete len:497 (+) Transcript_1902:56-1546(+)
MGTNCLASTSIGCLFCCKGCNAEKLRNAFTFLPPKPSYEVQPHADDAAKGRIVYTMNALNNSALYRHAAESSEVHWATTKKGNRIPVVWVRSASQGQDNSNECTATSGGEASPSLVLLHCHGNATDIGLMMGPYVELAKVLGIEVVGVEYSGYGAASGKPSSSNTYADLEAAYDLVRSSGVPANRIVAYGQSVGSGPVSNLAVTHVLAGLVLHSPLLSGIRVVDPQPERCCRPSCVWSCFDFYPNHKRAKQLQCPALVMHGRRDDIIPFYHGYTLYQLVPREFRWPAYFPIGAGHNNIVEADMRSYFGELSTFLLDLKKIASGLKVDPPGIGNPRVLQYPSFGVFRRHEPHQQQQQQQKQQHQQVLEVPSESASASASCSDARGLAHDVGKCGVADVTEQQEMRGPDEAVAVDATDVHPVEEVDAAGQPATDNDAREVVIEGSAHSTQRSSAHDFLGPVPEPAVGPTDGRYEQFRQGQLLLALPSQPPQEDIWRAS